MPFILDDDFNAVEVNHEEFAKWAKGAYYDDPNAIAWLARTDLKRFYVLTSWSYVKGEWITIAHDKENADLATGRYLISAADNRKSAMIHHNWMVDQIKLEEERNP